MRRVFLLLIVSLFVVLCLKACIRQDVPEVYLENNYDSSIKNIDYPNDNRNITVDGVDYIQSQAPIGKFGGELIVSTIGEGPKTFNPCNTKDKMIQYLKTNGE